MDWPEKTFFEKSGGIKGKIYIAVFPIRRENKIGSASCERCANLFVISIDEMWVRCNTIPNEVSECILELYNVTLDIVYDNVLTGYSIINGHI